MRNSASLDYQSCRMSIIWRSLITSICYRVGEFSGPRSIHCYVVADNDPCKMRRLFGGRCTLVHIVRHLLDQSRLSVRLDQARSQKCGLEGVRGMEARTGVRSGEGAVPPPQKIFCIFSFEMVHFDAFRKTMEVNCYNNILRLHMLNLSAKR